MEVISKPCYTLSSNGFENGKVRLLPLQFNDGNIGIIFDSVENIFSESSKKEADANYINNSKVLYFDSNSKFPRFKLPSKFKRCIKPENADVVVYNSINVNGLNSTYYNFRGITYVFEVPNVNNSLNINNVDEDDEDSILLLIPSKRYFSHAFLIDEYKYYNTPNHGTYDPYKLEEEFNHNSAEYLIKYDCLPNDAKLIYKGPVCRVLPKDISLVRNIIQNDVYKHIICDESLDKIINSTYPDITDKDFDSISNMLCSTDESVQSLGLKSLTTYNVNKYKWTVHFLLYENITKLKSNKTWQSASVKQMRDSIKFVDNCGTSNILRSAMRILNYNREDGISQEDLSICRNILLPKIKDALDDQIDSLKELADFFKIKISANATVE